MDSTDSGSNLSEKFRACVNEHTSLSMYKKRENFYCIIRKDLSKPYEVDVDASEAPITNKMTKVAEPYEISIADLKILEDEVFPINEAIKKVFGPENELKLKTITLAIGGSITDYVTVDKGDLIKFDVTPTLTGLMEFVEENNESIIGFLNSEYISEEGNVIYLNCGREKLSKNILSIKLKILASMQQRGLFLQQEHKYYGLQLYVIIASRVQDDNKLLEFLKELGIDWELIFFRRRLAIHDWIQIECEKDKENLKGFLRAKYKTLNYFDVNNITLVVVKNELPFIVADKMASLLSNMKSERINQSKGESLQDSARSSRLSTRRTYYTRDFYQPRDHQGEEYSITLKKAEIAAAAKLACAYLGIQKQMEFDRDIPITEILKYQEELTNI
ncbi:MAG: hypothetical protein ACTSU4_04580 [Promethearchaeota archaeon]